MSFSNYLEAALLNAVFRNTAFSSPATVYLALYTSNPGEANSGSEVSASGYARKAITFAAPASGSIASNAAVLFGPAGATWGTITHFALFDALTAGNMLQYGQWDVAKVVANGDSYSVASGALTLALD